MAVWSCVSQIHLVSQSSVCAGTGIDWKNCPAGTFSDQEGLYTQLQCQACPGGKYCQGEHLTAHSGPCLEGTLVEKLGFL